MSKRVAMGKTKVVISASGGVVNAVCADDPNLEVYLVDFDELKEDPKWNCHTPCHPDSLEDFCAAVKTDVARYPGLKKLIARLDKSRAGFSSRFIDC